MDTIESVRLRRGRELVTEYPLWSRSWQGKVALSLSITGTVWREIATQVATLFLLTIAACVLNLEGYAIEVTLVGHQIVLTSLSFLLVFRCSNSYQRYWEGKSLLDSLAYFTRELASHAATLATGGGGEEIAGPQEWIPPPSVTLGPSSLPLSPSLRSHKGSFCSSGGVEGGVDGGTRSLGLEEASHYTIGKVSKLPPHQAFGDHVVRYTKCVILLILRDVRDHWDLLELAAGEEEGSQKHRDILNSSNCAFLRPFLTGEEFSEIHTEQQHQGCIILLMWLRNELEDLRLASPKAMSPLLHIDIGRCITGLHKVWVDMLQITATPLPYPWVHLSSLVLWVFLLSMIPPAVHELSWVAPFFMSVCSLMMLGLQRVGSELEDPFGNDINDFDLESLEGGILADVDLVCSRSVTRHFYSRRAEFSASLRGPNPIRPKRATIPAIFAGLAQSGRSVDLGQPIKPPVRRG